MKRALVLSLVIGTILMASGLVLRGSAPSLSPIHNPYLTLIGYVRAQTDLAVIIPIPSAFVGLYLNGALQYSGTTDTNGYYAIYGIAPNTYTVRVNATGYKDYVASLTLDSTQSGWRVDFSLVPYGSGGGGSGTKCADPNCNVVVSAFDWRAFGSVLMAAGFAVLAIAVVLFAPLPPWMRLGLAGALAILGAIFVLIGVRA